MVAQLVFTGGPVHTVDPAGTRTGAVAVRGGRIVALGPAADAMAGPGTEVVNLRGRRLGVTANMQAYWAAHEPQLDELTIPFLGEERSGWQYPFGALRRAGATLAAGSDWPVTTPDPIQAVHVAVNRTLPGTPDPPFLPEQRLDLAAALAAYTAGSAYVNHLDDTGTIRVGARAGLALLDRDPFEHPADQIAATTVVATYVDGERVYAA